MYMKSIIVENCKKTNINVTNYILEKFPNLSKNILFKALRNKDIKVNQKRISTNMVIHNGDNIDIYIDDVYYTHLSAMSYLTTGGGYTLQYFDKEEDKVEIVDIENKVVVVKNENYEVNVSFDYLVVYNREVMLSSSDSKLKSINELN